MNLDRTQFMKDERPKHAYVLSIEAVHEAVKQLPDGFRQKYSVIEWWV